MQRSCIDKRFVQKHFNFFHGVFWRRFKRNLKTTERFGCLAGSRLGKNPGSTLAVEVGPFAGLDKAGPIERVAAVGPL